MFPVVGDVKQLAIAIPTSGFNSKLNRLLVRVRKELKDIHLLGSPKITGQGGDLVRRQLDVGIVEVDNLGLVLDVGLLDGVQVHVHLPLECLLAAIDVVSVQVESGVGRQP